MIYKLSGVQVSHGRFDRRSMGSVTLNPHWTTRLASDISELRLFAQPGLVLATLEGTGEVAICSGEDGSELSRFTVTGNPSLRPTVYHEETNLLFVPTSEDDVCAVAPESGTIEWSAAGSSTYTTTTDTVVLGGGATLSAYRAETGSRQWEAVLPSEIYRGVTAQNQRLLVEVGEYGDKGLVALDATTGDEEWYYRPGSLDKILCTDAGTFGLVEDDRGNTLVCIDDVTGTEQWSYSGENELFIIYIVADDKNVYVGDPRSSSVSKLHGMTGQKEWETDEMYDIEGLWMYQGVVYVNWEAEGFGDYILAAVDTESGRIRWRCGIDDRVRFFKPTDKYLYIGTNDYQEDAGSTYKLRRATGKITWQTNIGENVKLILNSSGQVVAKSKRSVDDGYISRLIGIDQSTGDLEWSITDDYIGTFPNYVGQEWMRVDTSDSSYIIQRKNRQIGVNLGDIDCSSGTGDACIIADGGEVTAYALSPDPEAFTGGGTGTGTSIYSGGNENSNTEIYEGERNEGAVPTEGTADDVDPAFCPSCGESLSSYDEITFCPHCGTGL